MTLRIPNAGSPRYIPRFNAITDNPSPRTSDSEFAFSIIANVESIGVNPAFTISLKTGFSRSMFYDKFLNEKDGILFISPTGQSIFYKS